MLASVNKDYLSGYGVGFQQEYDSRGSVFGCTLPIQRSLACKIPYVVRPPARRWEDCTRRHTVYRDGRCEFKRHESCEFCEHLF